MKKANRCITTVICLSSFLTITSYAISNTTYNDAYYSNAVYNQYDIQPTNINIDYKKNLTLANCGFFNDIFISTRNSEFTTDLTQVSSSFKLNVGVYTYKLNQFSDKVGYITVSDREFDYDKNLKISDILGLNYHNCLIRIPGETSYKKINSDFYISRCGTYKFELHDKTFKVKINPPDPNDVSINYKYGLSLKNIKLDNDWEFADNFSITKTGRYQVKVIYKYSSPLEPIVRYINLNVKKTRVTAPKINKMVYNPNIRLGDITLPIGFSWENPALVPQSGYHSYYVNYNPVGYESGIYEAESRIPIWIDVEKATPVVYTWPSVANEIVYGQKLGEACLTYGYASTPGSFMWKDINTVPTVKNNGYTVEYTPSDSNYKTLTGKVNVRVLKDMNPRYSETPVIKKVTNTSIEIVNVPGNEYSMDYGATWQNSNVFYNLQPYHYYDIVTRVKNCENTTTGYNSSVVRVVTKKDGPARPKAPEFVRKTNHIIEVEKVQEQEYSIDNGKTWQDSSVFNNLSGSTEYKIITRIKETDDTMPSRPSNYIIVKTKSFWRNAWDKISN